MHQGETDLKSLLCHMAPCLLPQTFVFTSQKTIRDQHLAAQPKAIVWEEKGITLVLPQHEAERLNCAYHGTYRCISLSVHSSLDAVGLTAAVATALAAVDISANMIAGAYHDHVFVPTGKAQAAMQALKQLANQSTA